MEKQERLRQEEFAKLKVIKDWHVVERIKTRSGGFFRSAKYVTIWGRVLS